MSDPSPAERLPLRLDGVENSGLEELTFTGRAATDLQAVPPGNIVATSWIPEDRIPLTHRRYVRTHVDRAARVLGLGHIRIRWFGPANGKGPHFGGDFWGIAEGAEGDEILPAGVQPRHEPMTIGILATLRGDIVPAVIAHEVRHVAQHLMRDGLGDHDVVERDANRFALAYASSLERDE